MNSMLFVGKIEKKWAALIVFAFMSVALLQSIGVTILFSTELSIVILTGATILSFFVFTPQAISTSQLIVVSTFLLLFCYTAITSRYPNVSLAMCFHLLASSIFFGSLVNADQNYLNKYPSSSNKYPISDVAKLTFISFATIQALCLIFFYLFEPVRTTGLMDDFSQASMLLLLAYGMAYPILKNKVFFTAFSLLYFTAFFTTFSRTANLLLVVLFAALFILEWKNADLRRVLKLAIIAILALIFIYWYPQIVGETTVDRGGLSHLSTLNSRTIYWQAAWQAILQKPFLGHGLGLYGFTGINEAQPFNIILYVHNDYLQVWHDLGVFWFTLFVSTLGYLVLRFLPIRLDRKSGFYFSLMIVDTRQFLAWSMLVTVVMYMGINFLINNIEFQIAIAILIADLLKK